MKFRITKVNFSRNAGFISFSNSWLLLLMNRFKAASISWNLETNNNKNITCLNDKTMFAELTYHDIAVGNVLYAHFDVFHAKIHFHLIQREKGETVLNVWLWRSFEIYLGTDALCERRVET